MIQSVDFTQGSESRLKINALGIWSTLHIPYYAGGRGGVRGGGLGEFLMCKVGIRVNRRNGFGVVDIWRGVGVGNGIGGRSGWFSY